MGGRGYAARRDDRRGAHTRGGAGGLPTSPSPHYREVDGLRLAHLDEGDGAPVVFLHGEPTWSFLWRKVIPPVRDAGFRCVAPDLAGFGRSDKPVDVDWYSYDRHVSMTATLLEDLDLRESHDGRARLGRADRAAARRRAPERIDRLVILDTGLFTGRQRMTDAWLAFRDFVARTEDLPVGFSCAAAARTTRATRWPPPTTRRSPTPPPRPARAPSRC